MTETHDCNLVFRLNLDRSNTQSTLHVVSAYTLVFIYIAVSLSFLWCQLTLRVETCETNSCLTPHGPVRYACDCWLLFVAVLKSSFIASCLQASCYVWVVSGWLFWSGPGDSRLLWVLRFSLPVLNKRQAARKCTSQSAAALYADSTWSQS